MKTITFTTTGLVTIVACIPLSAQDTPIASRGGLAERFDRVDRDGDGRITAKELPQPEIFRRLDRNGDGIIERSEIPGARRPATDGNEQAKVTEKLDLAYGEHASQQLDLYQPVGVKDAPIMVYIHGGGWKRGDKRAVGEKVAFFSGRGWVFASVNYDLLPEGKHPVNVNDVAQAIAWVHDHAQDYNGNPNQLFVMGHSAGAHLAALVATSEEPLKKAGKTLAILKGVIPLDTNAYDLPELMQSSAVSFYGQVFGDDPVVWEDASPSQHIAEGKGIPPFLICYSRGMRTRANPERPKWANAFAKKLRAAGVATEVVDASDRNHGEINQWFGRADDAKVTGAAVKFLNAILAGKTIGGADPETRIPEAETAPEGDLAVRFTSDYVSGTRDRNGRFMGGTETMRIVAHDGSLFAGIGYWTDQPGDDPRPGAQILRKDGPDKEWQVESDFPGALRVNAMESITFTSDYMGRRLPKPVSLLLADAGLVAARSEGELVCYVRDDAAGRWVKNVVTSRAPRAFNRTFGFHQDAVTGIDHVFAGTGAGEIYRGSYDPDALGWIRWEAEPEYANPDFDGGAFKRCQGFCVANGKLYASVSPRLLERTDGPEPTWREVFRWEPEQRAGAGLRGITAVSAPKGGHQVILGSREQEGRILRIDPLNHFKVTLELRSDIFLDETVGEFRGGKLVAYNRFVPGKHPLTDEPIHWVTVAGVKTGDIKAAWLMIRHTDGKYETVRVFDSELSNPPTLVSTRTLEFAPWSDREFYTGGYDGAANRRRNHNTAWIFKGTLPNQRQQP